MEVTKRLKPSMERATAVAPRACGLQRAVNAGARRDEPDDSRAVGLSIPQHRLGPARILIATMPPWPGPEEAEARPGPLAR